MCGRRKLIVDARPVLGATVTAIDRDGAASEEIERLPAIAILDLRTVAAAAAKAHVARRGRAFAAVITLSASAAAGLQGDRTATIDCYGLATVGVGVVVPLAMLDACLIVETAGSAATRHLQRPAVDRDRLVAGRLDFCRVVVPGNARQHLDGIRRNDLVAIGRHGDRGTVEGAAEHRIVGAARREDDAAIGLDELCARCLEHDARAGIRHHRIHAVGRTAGQVDVAGLQVHATGTLNPGSLADADRRNVADCLHDHRPGPQPAVGDGDGTVGAIGRGQVGARAVPSGDQGQCSGAEVNLRTADGNAAVGAAAAVGQQAQGVAAINVDPVGVDVGSHIAAAGGATVSSQRHAARTALNRRTTMDIQAVA